MNCPLCGSEANLVSADYGYGYGTQYRCYNGRAHRNEYTFVSRTPEAQADSAASLGASRANAARIVKDGEPTP